MLTVESNEVRCPAVLSSCEDMGILRRYDLRCRSEIFIDWDRNDFGIKIGDDFVEPEQGWFAKFQLNVTLGFPENESGNQNRNILCSADFQEKR